MPSRLAIIIPAFNEATVLADTLHSIRQAVAKLAVDTELIVVNDGSRDSTGDVASAHADVILTHRRNCGLGAALSTGIEYARRNNFAYCLTFDADGQHDPADIKRALKELEKGVDVVIGSRFLGSHSNMPLSRRIILSIGNTITFLFFGVKTSDSQSGFRAFSRRAIESIRLSSNRMEVSSEFFGEIRRHKLVMREIPIHVRYTKYSLSKGQQNTNAVKVLVKLLYQIIR